MKIVCLYSGGLDSYIMYHLAKKTYPTAEVKCIYYRHGADSEVDEIGVLPDFVEVRQVDWLGENCRPVAKTSDPFGGAIYIPGRNLVFSALAACQEVADEIWMGTVWDEDNQQATDKNEHFRNATSELLTYVLSPFIDRVRVVFPFVERKWSKQDSVAWALQNNITGSEITKTVSCWHHAGIACGECKQCFKRYFVFLDNGLHEEYRVHPLFGRHGQELLIKYLTDYKTRPESLNVDELNVIDLVLRNLSKLPDPIQELIKNRVGTLSRPVIER